MGVCGSAVVTDNARGVLPSSEPVPWFALRVRSNHEFSVRSALQLQGIREFLPTYRERVRWSDRFKLIERPLFPGYLLTQLDPTIEASRPVLAIAGVVHLLPSNLTLCPVPNAEVELIRQLVDSGLPLRPAAFALGNRVTVVSGALQGVSGVIARVKGETQFVVSVEMFGRAVSVDLDEESLRSCR